MSVAEPLFYLNTLLPDHRGTRGLHNRRSDITIGIVTILNGLAHVVCDQDDFLF